MWESRRRFFGTAVGSAGMLLLSAQVSVAAELEGGTVSWPGGQALPTFPRLRRLDVFDVEAASAEVRVLLATLQGLTSRLRPRIYLSGSFEEGRDSWLHELGVPGDPVKDLDVLVRKYRAEVAGVIVPDPAVPASLNVATTLAGLRDALVAPAGLAARFGLPVLEDLRGRFTDASAAYTWAVEHPRLSLFS